jgi:ABC-type amino acid transport substrate-binding protein
MRRTVWFAILALLWILSDAQGTEGVLKHLQVPYARFVTGSGDGLDVDLIKFFAKEKGQRYVPVKTTWNDWITDLTGKRFSLLPDGPVQLGTSQKKGDLAAHGITVLEWRKRIVEFSLPTFPTQVWAVARADSALRPIRPSGDLDRDIVETKQLMKGKRVLGIKDICVDPSLYGLEAFGAIPVYFEGSLNDIAPAILKGKAEVALLDAPDAMLALEKWPGQIKVLGPVSEVQDMAVAFDKGDIALKKEFDMIFVRLWNSKIYHEWVRDYYPNVFKHFSDFFERPQRLDE